MVLTKFLGLNSYIVPVMMKAAKYIVLKLAFIVLVFMAYAFSLQDSAKPAGKYVPVNDSVKVDSILKRAYKVMGTPYKWAGCTPKSGFDCSGFVYWCFLPTGVTTARSSSGLYNQGDKVDIEDAEAGDLILFKGTDARTKGVGHVGIVVSKRGEPLKFVHSSSSKQHWGVIETEYGGSYYIKRYIGIRRVLK
jgi:cell wall-associated NlpC family hydrolase